VKTHRAFSTGIVLVFLAGLLAWTTPPTAALAASTTFSGRATAVSGTVAGIPVGPLADTGEISPSGDTREATVLEYPISGLPDPTNGALAAEVLHAAVVAGGNSSRAEASVATFAVQAAGQFIGADFLMARASATCDGNSATVAGSSEIAGLTLNDESITVTGEANQTISLPLGIGQIVINEQVTGSSASANEGDITVNALHVVLVGGTDLVVASAHADIACGGTPPCSQHDFVTGGGWITTSSGSRANFAVAGGIKNDQFWGHLTYIDHSRPAMKVKGTAVTAYLRTGETSRRIAGAADVDGIGGTYIADVMDGGEPGHGVDTFSLSLSNGYGAGGLLGGGNIQLHCR
jgi:hypothetical protein